MNCCYPDCQHCPFEDCKIEHPKQRKRYHENGGREKQNQYREKKRVLEGRKTQKEQMVEKQDRIYEYLVEYIKEHLYPPSLIEIQTALGLSGSAEVGRDLKRLAKRGLIVVESGARAIRLCGYEVVEKGEHSEIK